MASHVLPTLIDVKSEARDSEGVRKPPSAKLPRPLAPVTPLGVVNTTSGDCQAFEEAGSSSPGGAHTGGETPIDLEMSRSTSPVASEPFDEVQTLSKPPMNKWRLTSACLMCFGNGLSDSAPGALIPYMEKQYHLSYALVSLIFVGQACGFVLGTPITYNLDTRFGRGKTLTFAEGLLMAAYTILVCTPPFPLVVIAFLIIGLGMALNLSLNNVFVANLANATTYLGFFHGAYGIGATIGPLMATGLVTSRHSWSNYYSITLAVVTCAFFSAFWTFRGYEHDNPHLVQMRKTPSGASVSKTKLLKESLKDRSTLLGALFIFSYQGAEVSISGWVISFLITYRGASPSRAGFVTAGFWGGVTLGRFLLAQPCNKIGEKHAVFGLVVGAACCQLLVWLVPNYIGEAVAVSIVGLLLGPVYPTSTSVFTKIIDKRLHVNSLTIISALGFGGAAIAPFFTGLLAQKYGTFVLHPICLGLFGVMLACWISLPRLIKRTE